MILLVRFFLGCSSSGLTFCFCPCSRLALEQHLQSFFEYRQLWDEAKIEANKQERPVDDGETSARGAAAPASGSARDANWIALNKMVHFLSMFFAFCIVYCSFFNCCFVVWCQVHIFDQHQVQLAQLSFDEQSHFAAFLGFVWLKQQERRNLAFIIQKVIEKSREQDPANKERKKQDALSAYIPIFK